MSKFTVTLPENRRTLKSITFPDGTIRPVKYMRDQIILFDDKGPGATYERSGDSVIIAPLESSEAASVVKAYLGRMGRVVASE